MLSVMPSAKLATLCAVFLLVACTTDPEAPPQESAPQQPPPVEAATRAAPTSDIVPGSISDFEQNVGDRVFFDYDTSTLDQTDRDTLARQAAWLNQFPNVVLTIEGHCDERGSDEYNMSLGEKRAATARDYLVNYGIAPDRISIISYGESRPLDMNHNEEAWSKNRRAKFIKVSE